MGWQVSCRRHVKPNGCSQKGYDISSSAIEWNQELACPSKPVKMSVFKGVRTRALTEGMRNPVWRWGTPWKPNSRKGSSNSSPMSLPSDLQLSAHNLNNKKRSKSLDVLLEWSKAKMHWYNELIHSNSRQPGELYWLSLLKWRKSRLTCLRAQYYTSLRILNPPSKGILSF